MWYVQLPSDRDLRRLAWGEAACLPLRYGTGGDAELSGEVLDADALDLAGLADSAALAEADTFGGIGFPAVLDDHVSNVVELRSAVNSQTTSDSETI